MVNKIYNLILVMLFALPVAAQTPQVTIDDVTKAPGTIEVPVTFEYFEEDVTAITLKIGFDNQVLSFIDVNQDIDGTWLSGATGGVITISYIGGGVDFNGKTIDLVFQYNGFYSALEFLPGSEIEATSGTVYGVSYLPGSVSLDLDATLGKVSMEVLDDVNVGATVNMPVFMEGEGLTEVSSISLIVEFDQSKLLYAGFDNVLPELGGDLFVTSAPGKVNIAWIGGPVDMEMLTKLFDLIFVFQGGGDTQLDFAPNSEVTDTTGEPIPLLFESGMIKQSMPEGVQLAISTVEAIPGQMIQLTVEAEGLEDLEIGSMSLKLHFDQQKLPYLTFSGTQLGPDDNFSVTPTGAGELTITAFNTNGITIQDGEVFVLEFLYQGGGDAPVIFMPSSQLADLDGEVLNVSLVNGGVVQKPAEPGDAVATIGKVNTLLESCDANIIYVPVSLDNIESTVGALEIEIGFTPGVLSYIDVIFAEENIQLEDMVEISSAANKILVTGFDQDGMTDGGKLFYIVFQYNGGSTAVEFLPGTEFMDLNGEVIPVLFIDGSVSPLDLDVVVTAEFNEIKTITTTPIIFPVHVHYGDLAAIHPDITADARILAEGGFPEGATIQQITYNGVIVPVVNGEIGGHESVLLSHILAVDPTPLAGHHMREDTWVITVDGIDEASETHILLESVASLGECTQVLDDDHMMVVFADALLTMDDPEAVCFDEEMILTATISYPEIVNVDPSILADALLVVEPALSPGVMISWDYNGIVNGTYEITGETTQLYLSEIVGSQTPLVGHSNLVDVWTFGLTGVHAGDYTTAVHALAQLGEADYVYADEEVAFTVLEEPVLAFEFNGQLAQTGSIFEYCFNEEVVVTLSEVHAGLAPFHITVEVNGDEQVFADVEEGHLLFEGLLEPGTYDLVITNITDDNGCSVITPELFYNATVIVHPEPWVHFAFNGEIAVTGSHFAYCYNTEVEVTLDEIVFGAGPITFHYVLNDDDPVEVIAEEGDVLFGPDVLPVGFHTLKLVYLEDGNGCVIENVEDIYTMNITVHPEPAVLFAFNDEIVVTGSELHYFDDDEVTVTLHEVLAGVGPLSLTYVLNDDDPVTIGNIMEGDILFGPDVLPVGEHSLVLTSLIDANGCEASNPEDIYYLTIIVEPSYIDVPTLLELRQKEQDGTLYRYTGNAVIVAMDGFRNRKFIQDETAAILIDDQPGIITTEYELYDVITNVVGVINIWNNMVRFQPQQNTEPAVENTPVDPYIFALDEVTSDDQAKLVQFEFVYFVGAEEGDTFANGTNYTITDGENTFVMRTDFWNIDGITGEQIPLGPVNLTGVIIQFQQTLQIVPRLEDDIEELFFEVTFNIEDVDGNSINDAVVTLNGVENAPGDYVFTGLIPGEFQYTVVVDCLANVSDVLVIVDEDLFIDVVMTTLPGDANGDGIVSVSDIVLVANYILGLNPQPFCFANADVDGDDEITIADIVLIADIIAGGGKLHADPGLISDDVYISLAEDRITFESDGSIVGIQFEIRGDNMENTKLTLNASGYNMIYKAFEHKVTGIVFNLNNISIPEGKFELIQIDHAGSNMEWDKVLAVNFNVDFVPVVTSYDMPTNISDPSQEFSFTAYPNPADDYIRVDFVNPVADEVTISLININGQTVARKMVNQEGDANVVFDVSGLTSGLYLIRLEASQYFIMEKIMIK